MYTLWFEKGQSEDGDILMIEQFGTARYFEHQPHVDGQKPHMHFKNGTSINNDGTAHDAGSHRAEPEQEDKRMVGRTRMGVKNGILWL